MAGKYETLDQLILDRIAMLVALGRAADFTSLLSGAPRDECERLADEANAENGIRRSHWRAAEPWRILDRRLQAMRRAGKIEFKSGARKTSGWVAVAGQRETGEPR
ncbi:hypothetical protein ACSI5F_03645 [Ralstonia pseudosolanacearum]|uniref:hypothetical protein n=1 Tax=Ralstonia pseudosolanacearum TaxID=1310165 RepID=UPI003EDE85E4